MTWGSGVAPGTRDSGNVSQPWAGGLGASGFDIDRAHPARVDNVWLGGKDHFAPDREAAEQVARIAPWVVAGARANRAFLRRSVAFLARQGVTQFLDVGVGLPSAGSVHEVAQRFQPDARVCYLDNDPVVLAHARALLAGGNAIAVAGDARDPQAILADPGVRAHLDFERPVAVLFLAVLPFLGAGDDPAGVVAAFRTALAPGSFVAISHVADLPDGQAGVGRARATREAAKRYQDLVGPVALRSPEEIAGLFAGFDLLEPGLVPVQRWHPDRGRPGPPVPVLAGVGRLPGPGALVRSGPGLGLSPRSGRGAGREHRRGEGHGGWGG